MWVLMHWSTHWTVVESETLRERQGDKDTDALWLVLADKVAEFEAETPCDTLCDCEVPATGKDDAENT